ncbi:MAG: hypothetical protein Q8J78_08835 [Moraxellaceae bacterium]|nr:hypothetical protein [Moraxellaceae bacterium]
MEMERVGKQRTWGWLFASILLCFACLAQAAPLTVQVLGASGSSGDAFIAGLARDLGNDWLVTTEADVPADMVIALHDGVLPAARELRRPLLLLRPDPDAEPLRSGETAIYWAPSWTLQLQLARLLHPGLRRAGLLLDSSAQLPRARLLREHAEAAGFVLQWRVADASRPLRDVAELAAATDVLLAPAGSRLFGRDLLRPVLLAAYRQNRVFVGGSPAIVHAGSLASLHASPATLASETAERLRDFARDGRWLPPARVRRFEVILNAQVARALGRKLPDADELTRILMAGESPSWP